MVRRVRPEDLEVVRNSDSESFWDSADVRTGDPEVLVPSRAPRGASDSGLRQETSWQVRTDS